MQVWLGVTLNPPFWGWISTHKGLNPKMMARDAAPKHLLCMISCCKKGCGNACSCRKAGLKWSSVYRHCSKVFCDNISDVAVVGRYSRRRWSVRCRHGGCLLGTRHRRYITIPWWGYAIQIRTNLNRDLPSGLNDLNLLILNNSNY